MQQIFRETECACSKPLHIRMKNMLSEHTTFVVRWNVTFNKTTKLKLVTLKNANYAHIGFNIQRAPMSGTRFSKNRPANHWSNDPCLFYGRWVSNELIDVQTDRRASAQRGDATRKKCWRGVAQKRPASSVKLRISNKRTTRTRATVEIRILKPRERRMKPDFLIYQKKRDFSTRAAPTLPWKMSSCPANKNKDANGV